MDFKKTFSHPFLGIPFREFIRLLYKNGFHLKGQKGIRIVYLFFSAILMSMLSWLESVFYRKKIEQTPITQSPIFIIGHWRSGTTYLHYMLAKDQQFGFFKNTQAFMPHSMLVAKRLVRWLIRLHIMLKRPMDDVALNADSPQEEEFALSNYGTGAYLGWFFPKQLKHYFFKYILIQNLNTQEQEQFKTTYRQLIRKATLANGNQLLILKNPANTARIKMLLELFPDARFIYLHRDPYEVYLSTIRLHEKLIEHFSLQKNEKSQVRSFVPAMYNALLSQYEEDKSGIPAGHLIEMNYNDLLNNPLQQLKRIYTTFQIEGFENAHPAFMEFLESQKQYEPAVYQITETIKQNIDHKIKAA